MSNSLDVVNLPVNALAGVGTKVAEQLAQLEITRVALIPDQACADQRR